MDRDVGRRGVPDSCQVGRRIGGESRGITGRVGMKALVM